MTDGPPKKRPWFQLHLSTCVVLMFVAGVLVWANVQTSRVYVSKMVMQPGGEAEPIYAIYFGWPFKWLYSEATETGLIPDTGAGTHIGIALNGISAFAILALVALVCEYFIRRRGRNRAATEPAP